ncbi:hypothetical protein GRAQ_01202 [Rahnella aquatilis CIP 78.65 = ATCC 33071]|uniref:Uncharacterized protein n=1 Tax=Rahnella aquatilis (strain ATCC 33071 / DSM 4594 / JCM 1683 / NBRC 105701 / NCIMB 13365 / CIP 78.65) TaxID=745277 RepID=H2IYM2_RAHAC|nr:MULTISPECIES: hypothetical protein [Rahnella]AEX52033.1 hypothetical protein Rahaq2_2172 [Rahnella aquatilis CIP 78.65 = ATCC 33071]KFD14252.1 hypothetical protein GRAQ_01202 [Rahnella aquatilis CIP 78.65 = ATCC 33071]MBU9823480.1 hypothetical protein [Rahnella perminowiae]
MNKLNIILLNSAESKKAQAVEISIKNNGVLHALFTGIVDFQALIEWLKENEDAIRKADFPIVNLTQDSLAKKVHCFYESVDVDDDDLIDAMFDYRTSHCLRFACRGVDFPEIYIGKLGSKHEISLFTDNETWRYFFDVDDFFGKLKC